MKNKYFVYDNKFLKCIRKYDFNINDFNLLVYLNNNYNNEFDVNQISDILSIKIEDVMNSFDKLLSLKLVSLETVSDLDGKMKEVIKLDGLYKELEIMEKEKKEEEYETKIYDIFEIEFVRTLSPTEYEIINAWLDSKYSEELIIGALKEAIYNGAPNLKYIDKVLYEWHKKGYQTMDDVNNRNNKKNEENNELFDYNWLEDDE